VPLIRLCAATVLAVWLLLPGLAQAGTINALGRAGYQALPSLFWQELESAKANKEKVVVFFTADWCSPCKSLKTLMEESPVVQRAIRDLRVLFVDVDEWRGPAHGLIAGAMPSKLPMLARVDAQGQLVQLAMGTQMGLLSEEATAGNFRRLAFGKVVERPAYLDDHDAKMALVRENARKRKARNEGVERLEVEVLDTQRLASGETEWRLRVLIRNLDSRRRWFVLPGRLGALRPDLFEAKGRETLRFNQHVRAHMTHLKGEHDLYVLPLAGASDVELSGWVVRGQGATGTLELTELKRFTLGGEAVTFEKKVPYELRIADARDVQTAWSSDVPVAVELIANRVLSAPLTRP
jgi:thiol-disulfide isomerase/thioredoxin